VHGLKRPSERLGGAVAMSNRDVEQRLLTRQYLRRRDGQSPTPDVLGQPDPRQRGEQPPEVILRRGGDPSQLGYVDRLVELPLDIGHHVVEPLQHLPLLPLHRRR